MNERFLELAHQAKIEFTYDPTETPMRAFAECWEDELEKFAELIIRECADLFEVEWGSSMLQGTTAAHYLKQHFGVEE